MLAKDDDVIQTFAADRADEALDIGVLPKGRDLRLSDHADIEYGVLPGLH